MFLSPIYGHAVSIMMFAEVLALMKTENVEKVTELFQKISLEIHSVKKVDDLYFLVEGGILFRDFSVEWCIPDSLSRREYIALR